MVNVQQVDKDHDLFKISHAGGFSDPNCTNFVQKHIYMCKSDKYGRFSCFNYESIHVQKWYVIIFL